MPRRLLSVAALLLAARCAPVPSTTDAFGYRRPPPGREAGTSFAALDRALVRALERGQPASLDAPPPPLALTTSDGAGLALTALHVEAVVVGPLALTQLHLTFHNPEPRVREGRFTIALPPGAAVSRFAMKNEAWLEAEVVPRQEARRVYETYLHRQTDPALLEQDAGNGFSARVFPIAASGDKELIIAYGHALTDAASRRVALAGLPAVDDLTWDITAAGHTDHGHAARTAPADLVLPATDAGPVAIAAGGAFVARVPLPAATARDPLDAVTLLIDTSASRAALIGRQAALVRTLLAELAAWGAPPPPPPKNKEKKHPPPHHRGPDHRVRSDRRAPPRRARRCARRRGRPGADRPRRVGRLGPGRGAGRGRRRRPGDHDR